jgi:hypothetical protein
MKRILIRATLALAACCLVAGTLQAEVPQVYCWRQAQSLPWHNGFYDPYWGEPIALVCPPNAEFQANYGWGVGGTRVSPLYHQFARPFPGFYGQGGGNGRFLPTPNQPSDTQQFGVYYVRGPW